MIFQSPRCAQRRLLQNESGRRSSANNGRQAFGQHSGILGDGLLVQVEKYMFDYMSIFDAGYQLDSTGACFAGCKINIESSLAVLYPSHRSVTIFGIAIICLTVFMAFGALPSFSWCYQSTVFSIGCEHAMDACQIGSWPGYQGLPGVR